MSELNQAFAEMFIGYIMLGFGLFICLFTLYLLRRMVKLLCGE